MNAQTTRLFCLLMASALLASPALAGFDSGSDETDGALNCAALFDRNPACGGACDQTCTVVFDLTVAAEGPWDTTPGTGNGVYDAEQWAVVFKYSTIDIPADVTVRFVNHSSGAPVFWLATGGVTIGGTVDLNGGAGPSSVSFAEPGPGGFHGGRRTAAPGIPRTPGFGPGGGATGGTAGAAGHAEIGGGDRGGPPYGSTAILPLIGGSGGGVRFGNSSGGGAGGGAILIASNQSIEVSGTITADGGDGGSNDGSGGAIRLVAADTVARVGSPGLLSAIGDSSGSVGRIRLEALTINFPQSTSNPDYFGAAPSAVFPDFADTAPTLKATFVDLVPITDDPDAGRLTTDVVIDNFDVVTLEIAASNIPPNTVVEVRIVSTTTGAGVCQFSGGAADLPCPACELLGSVESSSCIVPIQFPPGQNEIQLRAQWTPECGDGLVNVPGEECDGADDEACPGQCQPDCTCG